MPSLFDFLNRHQIYLEGVKNWYHNDFLRYLKLLRDKLLSLLGKVGVQSLGELTKAKLNKLMSKVSDIYNKTMGDYGNEFLQEFRRFTRIDTVLQRSAFSVIEKAKNFTEVTVAKTWLKVSNEVVPALAATPKQATEQLLSRAKDYAVSLLKQHAVDAEKLTETVAQIVGNKLGEAGTMLGKTWSTVRGFVSTVMQHASAQVSDAVGSIVYGCYQWVSVIDSVTTDICRERNGNVYRYGQGPTAPAHQNCRSRNVPCPCDDPPAGIPTFYAWLKNQSESLLSDVFGASAARKLKDGTSKASDYLKFSGIAPLTVEEFELKAATMLS